MSTPKVESEQHGELNCWRITTDSAELLVAQRGAQVLSYQRLGEPPLLWLSDQALFKHGKSVRAGVPVCWPWFGNQQRNPEAVRSQFSGSDAPAHGLVRGRDWQLLGIDSSGDSPVPPARNQRGRSPFSASTNSPSALDTVTISPTPARSAR